MKNKNKMFNKIMKRGKKCPKESIEAPVPAPSPPPSNVTVNHASRTTVTPKPTAGPVVPPRPTTVEVLPNLKDTPLTEKHGVFIRKVHVCCFFFDFVDTMKSAREKEIKRQTLAELIDIVQTGSCKMNEIMQDEMVKMIALNIFRCLPPAAHEITGGPGGDPEEEDMYMDPSWPHLQLVYELLLRYVVSSDTDARIAKRYLNHSFVLKLLDLFDCEDIREREYLKTILHRMYGRFMVHRPYIRSAMNNILYRFIFETERYGGVNELLEIFSSIIYGFSVPMKEEHKLFLIRALIPLHKPKCVASYHHQLSYCMTLFVEKDYRLADIVIRGLLKCWPISNCGKEVLFLGELEEILEFTQSLEFKRCMVPLFKQIGRSIRSPHFQVAERALFWWNNEHIVALIADNRHVILPIIFDPLEKNIQYHWNQAINGLSSNVRRMFVEMDSDLYEQCQTQYEEKETMAEELEERRITTWKRLEEVADEAV
ncbi:serine/threonine protein phosphatase 2A 57 kDa regulatory subunit B' beta isoform-like [Salvia divinorum]|uniref:Serine/threonine protein phosphatase 2A regulatory subunit n=1 Tax=Salvia divinorum TaxID=28513 RepID=A0ABD1GHE6_SALDI